MPSAKPADVDSYLAAQPAEVRAALGKVRAAMRRALPGSVEAIKYGMPAYLVDGRAVASFAGWKASYAVYIVAPALFEAIRKDLVGREASKGIIRFELDEPVPESVFKRLATWRADAARAPKAAKRKPPKAAKGKPAPKAAKGKPAPKAAKGKPAPKAAKGKPAPKIPSARRR